MLWDDKSPLISVVIPTYNRVQFIERAVRSVLNQTYSNLEVIVVDDGSVDETYEIIDRLKKQDGRLIFLRHFKNKGPQAARNTGIHASSGDFVAFLDSDNEWLPAKLEKRIRVFYLRQKKVGSSVFC